MTENIFEVQQISADDEKSVAHVTLRGFGPVVENSGSDTTYRVLKGSGVIKILKRDTLELVEIPVDVGSDVLVSRGNLHAEVGDMDLEATCVPPFDPDKFRIV